MPCQTPENPMALHCSLAVVAPLPSSPATVAFYLGTLYASGRVRGGSILPYLAAMGIQHCRCGFADPTHDPLFHCTRSGYRACDQARVGAPATRSLPLPARCVLRAARAATRAQQRDGSASAILGSRRARVLLCSRLTAVRLLERDDIDVELHAITLQMRTFKGSEIGAVPR
jgi:hypothetical protein